MLGIKLSPPYLWGKTFVAPMCFAYAGGITEAFVLSVYSALKGSNTSIRMHHAFSLTSRPCACISLEARLAF